MSSFPFNSYNINLFFLFDILYNKFYILANFKPKFKKRMNYIIMFTFELILKSFRYT